MTVERWILIAGCFGISGMSGFIGTISSLHSGVEDVKQIPSIKKEVEELKVLLLPFKKMREENHQILGIVSSLKIRADDMDRRIGIIEHEIIHDHE